MNWFTSRRKNEQANQRDLNQLVFDVAEFYLGSDEQEVFSRLPSMELFAQVLSCNFEFENGKKIIVENGMKLSTPTVQMHGLSLLRFHIN